MKAVHVLVRGRVQGVWFRGATQREAERLGVAGWVRNLPDGRVEVVVEGEDEAVDRLVDWCGRGPSGAKVLDLETASKPSEGLSGFDVRY